MNSSQNLIDLTTDCSLKCDNFDDTLVDDEKPIDLVPIKKEIRSSLDNNPFDKALKQANLLDDPFESVAMEAEMNTTQRIVVNVKTENLLSLSEYKEKEEEMVDVKKIPDKLTIPTINHLGLDNSDNVIPSASSVSSFNSPRFFGRDNSGNISPIGSDTTQNTENSSIGLNKAVMIDSTSSGISNCDATGNGSELNKAFIKSENSSKFESSTENTPRNTKNTHLKHKNSSETSVTGGSSGKKIKGKSRTGSLDGTLLSTSMRNQLLKLSLSNSTYNSPLRRSNRKSDEFDSSVFSEARSLAEMFSQITMSSSPRISEDSCDDIMAIKPNWVDSESDFDSDLELMKIPILQEIDQQDGEKANDTIIEEKPIEDEVDAKQVKTDSDEKIVVLKEKVEKRKSVAFNRDLDDLIENLKKKVAQCQDQQKQLEANNLLENLSNLLKKKTEQNADQISNKNENFLSVPAPIVRQGTFDMDKPNLLQKNSEKQVHPVEAVVIDEANKVSPTEKPFNVSLNIESIAQQVSQLLNSEIHANIQNGTGNGNPTYIVLMSTPQVENHIKREPEISPEFEIRMRPRRSFSLSSQDKRKIVNNTEDSHVADNSYAYNTPVKSSFSRRNSISHTPTQGARRSIYAPNGRMSLNPSSYKTDNNLLKNTGKLKLEADAKKFKLRTSSINAGPRLQGPLKATMPVRKIPQTVITPATSPVKISQRRKNIISSTPLTSTSLKTLPIACSTPSVGNRRSSITPTAKQTSSRSRLSYISSTPNPRSSTSSYALPNHRRSLSNSKISDKPTTAKQDVVPQMHNLKKPLDLGKPVAKIGSKTLKKRVITQNGNKENNIPE